MFNLDGSKSRNFCDLDSSNILPSKSRNAIYVALCRLKAHFLRNPVYSALRKKGKLNHKGYLTCKSTLLSDHASDWKSAYSQEIKKLELIGGLTVVQPIAVPGSSNSEDRPSDKEVEN